MGVALTNDTLETSIEEIVEKQKSSYNSHRKLLDMKKYNHCYILFFTITLSAQDKKETPKTMVVEASCGQCQFGMKGYACDLAVRIDGNHVFCRRNIY
jgi:hypothetical protein